MKDADNLAMLGRVMGGLLVVLLLIGLTARVARRVRGPKSTSSLRVIDRIGLSREANLTVIEVANRVLLLGVTAQGVTMLADLDTAAERDASHERGAPSSGTPPDDAGQERGVVTDRGPIDVEPRSPRRPVPTGVALEEYPDLASALRAAGRTSESPYPATHSHFPPTTTTTATTRDILDRPGPGSPNGPGGPGGPGSPGSPGNAPAATAPRTRAEARAEVRARAAAAAAAQASAASYSPAPGFGPVPGSGPAPTGAPEIDRIPLQRNANDVVDNNRASTPSEPASGSVLSPRTWRQGIEALRDLTVRRG